jgi:hypothetical protein
MRKTQVVVLVSLLAASSLALAGTKRHPNLVAAFENCQRAIEFIVKAQEANDMDMGGHAQKAKALIAEAESELKIAAQEATVNTPANQKKK